MTKNFFRILTVIVFIFCALGIGALVFFPSPWNAKNSRTETQPRIVIPRNMILMADELDISAELIAWEDSMSARVALGDGEAIVSVLNGNFDGGPIEKQLIAYRNLLEIESPIYLTFIDYDEASRTYMRLWSAPTAATRPGTINLYTMDLLGDRSLCVLISGVNHLGEHTLTIFRRNPPQSESTALSTALTSVLGAASQEEPFDKIAELRIDGTITVRETARSQAYQRGMAREASFNIVGYGRDFESTNILDQVEIIYAYNPENGFYEQINRTRIPGPQVEQRRVRELLGNRPAFEEFITGLWYYIGPQGIIDRNQYIYFDPPNREIIFYGEETQQVFSWQNSTTTRYGLFISSHNISVSTLRRSIDLELESLESIRVRILEDVRLPVRTNAPWDGSYRKAGPPEQIQLPPALDAHIDALYDGTIGKLRFFPNGAYELNHGGAARQGRYAFFSMNDQELLELRPAEPRSERETYLIRRETEMSLSLLRVRIGARGVDRLNEGAILLTLASE